MPSAAVETAFRTRLASNWDTADGVILGANGVTTPPADGSAFLLIQYPVATGLRPFMRTKRYEEGAARIIFNVPSGEGLSTFLTLADDIAAIFRGDHLIIDGVEVFEPSPPFINDNSEDGNYYELAVIVPYRYQFNTPPDSP